MEWINKLFNPWTYGTCTQLVEKDNEIERLKADNENEYKANVLHIERIGKQKKEIEALKQALKKAYKSLAKYADKSYSPLMEEIGQLLK